MTMSKKQNKALKQAGNITEELRKTLVSGGIIPAHAPDNIVAFFGEVCKDMGLNPLNKEAHIIEYTYRGASIWNVVVGIDAFRRKAAETGQLAGIEDVKFDVMPDGSFKTAAMFKNNEYPKSATATVYRMISGERCAFTKTVLFREYAKTRIDKDTRKRVLASSWAKMPFTMIGKVATMQALREAFSDIFGKHKIYIEEEIPVITGETMQAQDVRVIEIGDELKKRIQSASSVKELIDMFDSLSDEEKRDENVIAMFREVKSKLK